MATWKEKGVVPDSDDEDALDSQSITNDDEAPNGERNDDIGSAENVIEANNIDGDEEGELNLKQNRLEHSNAAAPAVLDGDSKNFIDAPVPTFEPEISSKHVDGHDRVPASSPNSPKIFKVPKVFWELEEEPEEEPAVEKEPRSISRQGTGKPADDEISRSYVQITSPTSSLLSSLPANEVSLPLNAPVHRRESTPHQIEGREAFLSANPVRENVQGAATIAYMGRSLRQRNPIQLHPYIVEQEKYRQTLKARGIAPMRIAPSQHESHLGSRQTTSPELDSQEKDSQDATETGDSQPMDFDWDPLPSSPLEASENNLGTDVEVHKFTKGDKEGEDDDDDDDEEFPDIDELLSTRLPLPHPINPRRRLKSYSTKSKIQVLSRLQNERKGNPVRKVTSTGVTNVPASPPATSSPFPAASRESTVSSSHTKSRSPDESSRTLSAPNNLNRQKLANLPTPATSATKPIPVSVDSESGDELSSSDESIQIRKVSKKIRGVLPASHLRLDYQQKKPQPTSRTLRDSFSISPIKTEARRGVALPRTGAVQSPSASAGPRFDFLSSDSDDDEETGEGGFIFEDNLSSPLDSLFSQSRLGLAEEDDRIDAMLPSRKRQPASSKTRQRKRGRFRSSTLLPATDKPYTRQPKITEHLNRPQQSKARIKSSKQPRKLTSAPREQNQNHTNVPRQPAPPRLSILDVVDIPRKSGRGLPQFIKIAARTARSKLGQGKQSPSRKFIRLANREDTHDAQLVLEDWKAGRILPNSSQSLYPPSSRVSGHPLREIENNRQSKLQPPIPKLKSDPQTSNIGSVGIRRKLIISRGKQQSMNAFISREQRTFQNPNFPARDRAPKEGGWRRERPRHVPPAARFAQLESSEIEQSPKCSANAFRSTKKTLDALYRITRKRPVQQANLQLCRFLGDGDVVRPSIEPKDTVDDVEPKVGMTSASTNVNVHNKSRRKKRSPRRVDAGAAMYRQPSDPLILDFLVPASGPDTGVSEGRKLVGLAKFGTHYPLNFDIFPLRSGIFFHESTFIGSGRLSESIRRTGETHPRIIHSHTSLMLAGKTFSWGQWNEDVSSELGLSFDWLVDQLISQHSPLSSPPTIDAVGVISFVLEYVHHHLSFGGFDDVKNFLYRMTEILQDVSSRLNTAGENSKYQTESRAWIGVTSMSALLLLELLRIARARNEESLAYQLEDLMKKFATQCVKALVSQGLDCVRKLYDDLQYLSFREGGITSDEYVVQGWVIVMKVLEAAHIPRGSFWDVANSQIGGTDMKTISDARMMEKLWYTMFSLLPLCEFDEFGVIVEGRRQGAFFDNWSLPQQMLKRVFALYHANQRQSPGFNDYCRAIVSRCHYLMVEWGWWNCSIVVGTLFDFFGAHNLAHLRNEEAYASPHFLQELNKEPHLGLEPEDRCFHVFLKIVALAIKHFQQGGEGKSIRNLVARLMPNHNRQYPKEESIHQRDLASLRNHHDLLCTLYWAAAPQYRPSPTLIQELVLVDHSHKEACLINLRAWEQLASFVLAHDDERDAYELLKLWYQDFFSKLVQQYLKVEGEIRDQAHALQGTNGQILQEKQLQEIIMANKQTIMTSVCTSVKAIGRLIDEAQHPSGWINAYQTCKSRHLSLITFILIPA
jgi:hypothetical protein